MLLRIIVTLLLFQCHVSVSSSQKSHVTYEESHEKNHEESRESSQEENQERSHESSHESSHEKSKDRDPRWGNEKVIQFLPFEQPENPFRTNFYEEREKEKEVAGFVKFVNKVMEQISR